jgi:hypothetical protein
LGSRQSLPNCDLKQENLRLSAVTTAAHASLFKLYTHTTKCNIKFPCSEDISEGIVLGLAAWNKIHLERRIVCTPLSVNVFVTHGTQLQLEYHCKTLFETFCAFNYDKALGRNSVGRRGRQLTVIRCSLVSWGEVNIINSK